MFVCLLRISFACFGPLLQCKQSRQAGRQAPPSVARPRQLNLIPNCQFSVRKRQQQQHRQQHCVLSASEKETGVEGGGSRVSIMQLQSEKLNKVFNLMTNSLKRCQQQSCQRDREREFSQSCHRAASMFSVCSLFVGLSLLMGIIQRNFVRVATHNQKS